MPPSALALVITAALLHALWNVAAKKAGGDHRFARLTVLMTVVLWVGVGQVARRNGPLMAALGALFIAAGVAALALG